MRSILSSWKPLIKSCQAPGANTHLILNPDLLATEAELPSIPRRLIDLEIMHLAFLAAGRDRHAYASAGVGAACGPVPAFLIGIDQIAIFPMHHALA